MNRLNLALMVLALTASTPAAGQAAETPRQAIERLSVSVRNQPADFAARRNLAEALIKAGLTVRAAEQMQIVMRYGKPTNEDLVVLADAQRYSGKFADAVRTYQEALNGSPSNARAISGLAYSYLQAGDTGTAKMICRNALKTVTEPSVKRDLAQTLHNIEQTEYQNQQSRLADASEVKS